MRPGQGHDDLTACQLNVPQPSHFVSWCTPLVSTCFWYLSQQRQGEVAAGHLVYNLVIERNSLSEKSGCGCCC